MTVRRLRTASARTFSASLSPSADTYLDQGTPDTNYATSGILRMSTVPGVLRRSLLKFDLTGVGQIQTATLRLRSLATGYGGTPFVRLHRVLDANDWVLAEATWNARKAATAWAGATGCRTAGTDYSATAACAAVAVPADSAIELAFDAAGIADLQAQVAGTNRGFVLVDPGIWSACQFYPTEEATAAYRPVLVLTYT